MEIISPKYSFIKFDSPEPANSCCIGDETFCIPVIADDDIIFQFIASGEDLAEGNAIYDNALENVELLLLSGNGNTPADIATNTLRNWTAEDGLLFEKNRTARNQVTYLWRNVLKDILTLVDCNACFQLAVKITIGDDDPVIGISNCLVVKCDDCFTSILEYYNDEDYAEFNYCNVENGINRVRLPFYLEKPKYLVDRSVYRKSTGAIKVTKSTLTEEYEAVTEFFPKHLHDKITIALEHDNVQVESGAYTGGISKSGDYAVEWTDNMCLAPATFKATATPYAIRNNNCADCQEVDLSTCEPVGFSGDPLPDAITGLPYNAIIVLTGTPPFAITAQNIPEWMNASLVDDTITLSGTPSTPATEIAVEFTITNCDDASSYDFADVIDITAECVGPAIDNTPLPDAVIAVPYSYAIPLTGTAPFNLSVITKPAWMTMTIVGSTVELTGTPDAEGVVDVIFNIENCAGAHSDGASLSLIVTNTTSGDGEASVDECGNGNAINEIRFNGDVAIVSGSSYPIIEGQNKDITILNGALNGDLEIDIVDHTGGTDTRIRLTDSNGNFQCLPITANGTYTFNNVDIVAGLAFTIEVTCGGICE